MKLLCAVAVVLAAVSACVTGTVTANAATVAAKPLRTVARGPVWAVESYAYAAAAGQPVNPDQTLTATYALGRRLAPWVVTLHGGSWIHGAQSNTQDAVNLFSVKGWQVFNMSYRIGPDVSYDEQVSDLRTAKAWILAHAAQFGIDPHRGSVYGFSSGGHLAAVLGLSGGFRSVVSVAGVLQPHRVADDAAGKRPDTEPATDGVVNLASREVAMMGCPLAVDTSDCGKRWSAFEPQTAITATSPPFLMFQGLADPVVPPPTADAFKYWLGTKRIPSTVVLAPGVGHTDLLVFGNAAYKNQMLTYVADHSR